MTTGSEHLDPDHERRVDRVLDGLGRAARARPLRGAPRLGTLRRRAAQRRRRHRAGAALAALGLLVPTGLGLQAVTTGDRRPSERVATDPGTTEVEPITTTDPLAPLPAVEGSTVEPEVVPLAPSPLAAREAMASVWTGTELLIWGGGAGGQVDGGTFADGAAYDPDTDTWRMLAPAPLAARARAAAVWTGSEMLVWGGSGEASGVGGFLDGAAYDPDTDTWRPIAAAPPGTVRSFPSAAWVAGHMVVGGGLTPSSQGQDALVYDVASDTWSEVIIEADVVQVVAAGERAAVLTWDRMERRSAAVTWLDPTTGTVEAGPELGVEVLIENVGGVWTGEELVLLVHGPDEEGYPGGLVASVAPGEPAWRDRRPVSEGSSLVWPVHLAGMADPALLAWTGTDAVAFARQPSRYDPATGRAVVVNLNLDRLGDAGCGYDAAQAWTGTEVIWWGGQWCRGSETGVSQAATGARVAVPAP